MRTRAAALLEQPGKWQIVDVDLDEPSFNEVLVRFEAAGLCHSDDHAATGDMPVGKLPLIGGHEGAGVVEAVGPGVSSLAVGDHVVAQFVPSCGRCVACSSGRGNLCDLGMYALAGSMADGTYRAHLDGADVGQMTMVGTFARHAVVSEFSVTKIDDDIPFHVAPLLSCGVPTGWGSAEYAAEVEAGQTVIVMGVGGVGMNAVQAAAARGAAHVIAVDPAPFKRESAARFGATHTFADIDEAADFARSVTGGQGAHSAIVTVGVTTGEHVAQAVNAIGKFGTVVVTGIGDIQAEGLPINLWMLSMMQKRIQGVIFGMGSPTYEIQRLATMYKAGRLKLDELVTKTYRLDEINQAYADMHAGSNVRGVILHED
ncbi:S-(hydroxymethyl)glutathione dehydrogenase/alcohol dehydrogenase [Saccharomonospora amisosensis]|uniref:S-(Hydroxymethyl)glutathione dehydrogenase/alcohol dehydrogenase n=1 Tax=Saccharomonospora amisosensis TaxID=1128677 RepID=A0A7X5UQU2_9PSEU|nr:NDMA-dependent alcohol dehydrogenase [Saccharomonospora amisosensis]NIJ12528.1 S-(hydroxymethyl)glutathione dehydrogenase/alcohol dehydrogenase [Saccharomonospora amisosensis]